MDGTDAIVSAARALLDGFAPRAAELYARLGADESALEELGQGLAPVASLVARVQGDSCAITLVAGGMIWPAAFAHRNPESERILRDSYEPMPVSESLLTRQVLADPVPIVIPQVRKQDLLSMTAQQTWDYLERVGINSVLVVPVVSDGEVRGVMANSRDRPGAAYTEKDAEFLSALAALVASIL
jgi:GAF domain-containing protein